MAHFIVLILIIAGLGLGFYRRSQRKQLWNKWKADGDVKERGNRWYYAATVFTTSVDTVAKIYDALDRGLLDEAGVELMSESAEGYVFMFRETSILTNAKKKRIYWSVNLVTQPKSGERFRYKFAFRNISSIHGQDMGILELNLLLTQVERTMLSLDPDVTVERFEEEYNTKSGVRKLK